jgi:hypothetical protein
MTEETKRKLHLRSRRLLIIVAMVLMIASFFTGHCFAGVLIAIALFLLFVTIMMSLMKGCGACWASFWLSGGDVDCMGRG